MLARASVPFLVLCAGAALALAACGSGAGLDRTESKADHEAFAGMFRESAANHALPSGLLEAIAYVETRWHPAADDSSGAADHGDLRVYGIMGLHDDDTLGHSLREAAAAIGRAPSDLADSPALNIEGAAALIARSARESGVSGGDLAKWSEIVRQYSGIRELADSDDYVSEVYGLLRDGFSQNGIEIPAHPSLAVPAARAPAPNDPARDPKKPPVTWAPSPNYLAGRTMKPRYIVIHVTQGSFATSVSWLRSKKSGVSAHYVIRSSDGYIKQLVRDEDTAYHARCWNPEAIGVEHEGFIDRPGKYYTNAMYRASARLVRYLTAKFDIPRTNLRIVGHNIGDTDLIRRTDLEDCNTHPDPGAGWNWTKYLGLVTGSGT